VVAEPNWDTIRHGAAPRRRWPTAPLSSKPTLLATLLAGEYWVIYKVTGATLGEHPFEIGRFMLITINVVPLAIIFWLLARMVEPLRPHGLGANLYCCGRRAGEVF